MVGRVGLAVARATSRYFVWATSRYFVGITLGYVVKAASGRLFRRVELLSSLEAGSTADRAAEPVDIGMVCILHRLFVSAHGEDWVEFVGGFETCVTTDRTTMLVRGVGAMVVFVRRLVPGIIGVMRPGKVSRPYTRLASLYHMLHGRAWRWQRFEEILIMSNLTSAISSAVSLRHRLERRNVMS
jgi:hypothetical protein